MGGSHNTCAMPCNITHAFMYRARRGEQNEPSRNVIGLLHRAEGGGRVLWLGHWRMQLGAGFGAAFSHMRIKA
jgi:hypothetical protein